MRYRRSAAVLVSLAALPALAPAAHADPSTGAGAGKAVPFVSVGGMSVNDLLAEDFRPFYTVEAVPAWGRITSKGDGKTFYLHVFDWPKDKKLTIPELPGGVPKKARLLAGDKKIDVVEASGGEANYLDVPEEAPDAIDSVIAVERE